MAAASGEISVPAALTSTVDRWREQGEPDQPPIRWSREAWRRHFPSRRAFLDALPDRIDRAEATRHAAHAVTPEGAERAFLAAMIWGYGRVGYGPWRTARVLTENPDALDRLAEVAAVAREHGGLAAFRDLSEKPLRYLGVAFGTKVPAVRHRCSFPGQGPDPGRRSPPLAGDAHRPAPDDRRVAGPAVYERYVALLTSWAAELGLTTDTVEELIFRSAVSREGSGQWSESWAGESVSPEQRAQAALLELERLFDTADAAAAQDARPHLDALERIIRQGWTG